MRRVQTLLITLVMGSLLLGSVAATRPQTFSDNCRYFNQTGHYVCGEFRDFFEIRGGVEIFGYPLTEAFIDPTHNGLRVQYFQRARMEWHPYNPAAYRVQLGLLVDELGYSYPPAIPAQIPSSNSALHHYFPETRHVVSYAFLNYFREKGGLDIFGYPRSEFMYEDGYLVQYFQRARMEWHPERTAGSQMSLANLGEIYIERFGVPGNYDEPLPPPASGGEPAPSDPSPPDQTVTRLSASASVRYAITGRQGTQTIFVYVNDQRQRPVEGATVKATIRYPSNQQQCSFPPTNSSGFARCSFKILPSPPGKRVVIDVAVTYYDLEETTQIFFLPWW